MSKLAFNGSEFTLDDLWYPQLITLNTIYWDTTLGITTVFFVLMMYAIVKKSTKEMGSYKWYLCHQLLWSYAFDVHVSLWKPIPLWPFYVGYSSGVFSPSRGMFVFVPLLVVTIIGINMGVAIFMSTLHRFMQAAPFSKVYQAYNIIPVRITIYVVIYIFLYGSLILPVMFFVPDMKVIKEALINRNQVFIYLIEKEPSIFGFDPRTNDGYSTIFLYGLCIFFVCLIAFVAGMYFIFVNTLRKNKAVMSIQTYNLQLVLFRAITIQIFLALGLLLFPITLAFVFMVYGFRWLPKFSICAIMVTATHTFCDFVVIVYFVKVYRVFFKEIARKCLSKLGFKFAASITPITTMASTTAASELFRNI